MDTPVPPQRFTHPSGCTAPVWSLGFRPCRRCAACQDYTSWQWTQRSLYERSRFGKMYFATWTFRERGPNVSINDVDHLKDVQKALKRLRKNHPALRYLGAPEFGTQGTQRIHYHFLMTGLPTARSARDCWKQGYTHARLARSYDINYVAKYTTKQSADNTGYRTLASLNYGNPPKELKDSDTLRAIFDQFPRANFQQIGNTSFPYAVRSKVTRQLRENSKPTRAPARHSTPVENAINSIEKWNDCMDRDATSEKKTSINGEKNFLERSALGGPSGPSANLGGAPTRERPKGLANG